MYSSFSFSTNTEFHHRSKSLHSLNPYQSAPQTTQEAEEFTLPKSFIEHNDKKIQMAKFSAPSLHGVYVVNSKALQNKRKMAHMTEKAARWFQPEHTCKGLSSEKGINVNKNLKVNTHIASSSRETIQGMLRQKKQMLDKLKEGQFRGNIFINEFWCQKHFHLVGRKTGLLELSKKILECKRENFTKKQEKISVIFRQKHKSLFKEESQSLPFNSVFHSNEAILSSSPSHLPTIPKNRNQRSCSPSIFSNQSNNRNQMRRLLAASENIKEECRSTNEELKGLKLTVKKSIGTKIKDGILNEERQKEKNNKKALRMIRDFKKAA